MAGLTQTQPMILASQSPLRKELLQSAGLQFEVMVSPFDEDAHKGEVSDWPVEQQALFLAEGKARAVSERFPNHWVIGADQIGEFDGRPLFKPGNRENNMAMLMSMQGQSHQQHCAACVYHQGEKNVGFIDSVTMTMRALTQEEISAYVAMDQPYGCCGGYRYEGLGKYLFASVDGCYESILGLPLLDLLNYLQAENLVRLG